MKKSDEYQKLLDNLAAAKRNRRFNRGLLIVSVVLLVSYMADIVRQLIN